MATKKEAWRPREIYYIKSENSPYRGHSLSKLIFEDYNYINDLLNLIVKKYSGQQGTNELQKNLEYLKKFGEDLGRKKQGVLCPHCGKKSVTHFSFINRGVYGFEFDERHVYCQDCQQEARRQGLKLRRLSLSIFKTIENSKKLSQLGRQKNKDEFKKFLFKIFNLPPDPDDQYLFNFIKS